APLLTPRGRFAAPSRSMGLGRDHGGQHQPLDLFRSCGLRSLLGAANRHTERSVPMKRRTALALVVLAAALVLPAQAPAASPNGSAGQMPAYYDGQLFTINFKQQPSGGEASLLTHNGSINTKYKSHPARGQGVMFTTRLHTTPGRRLH